MIVENEFSEVCDGEIVVAGLELLVRGYNGWLELDMVGIEETEPVFEGTVPVGFDGALLEGLPVPEGMALPAGKTPVGATLPEGKTPEGTTLPEGKTPDGITLPDGNTPDGITLPEG